MDPFSSALSHQRILLETSLATVASECVVVRHSNGRTRSILSLSQIRGMTIVRFSHPGLLVLGAAALLISAAAHFSKEGGSAEFPIALLALVFFGGFFASRRSAVYFYSEESGVQTAFGAPAEAAAVIATVRAAQEALNEQDGESESLAS